MINSRPVFSIITPTFQRPTLLRRALQSVSAQTFKDYEHIIVDDSNELHTNQIIEEFKDERIILYKHSEQRGAAGGYNSGLKLARGEYILFLDDDDEYLPEFLNTVYNFFLTTGSEIGFVWSGISIVKDTERGEVEVLNKVWPASFPDRQSELVAATTIGNGYGVCIRKECIEKTGLYDESIKMGQDADFLFRLVRHYN
jgi:glycosyltransferase involved in cell wall biosynthesis